MDYFCFIKENILIIAGIIVILPIVITAILTFIRLSHMKTARPENYASNYIDAGSFHLTLSQDIFLYSNITKIPRPKPQNKN